MRDHIDIKVELNGEHETNADVQEKKGDSTVEDVQCAGAEGLLMEDKREDARKGHHSVGYGNDEVVLLFEVSLTLFSITLSVVIYLYL